MYSDHIKKIKIEMLKQGVTGADIAREYGWTRGYVSQIITGKAKNSEARKAVAEFLNCDLTELWSPVFD